MQAEIAAPASQQLDSEEAKYGLFRRGVPINGRNFTVISLCEKEGGYPFYSHKIVI